MGWEAWGLEIKPLWARAMERESDIFFACSIFVASRLGGLGASYVYWGSMPFSGAFGVGSALTISQGFRPEIP